MESLKKIRIDYYHYRIRKGCAYILMQKDNDIYDIPSHYVSKGESIQWDFDRSHLEDDGDLVILDCNLGTSHLGKKNKCWIPLLDIIHLNVSRNRDLLIHHCLAIFLDLCKSNATEPEDRLMFNKVEELFLEFLKDQAKDRYRNQLVRVRDGEPVIMMDASISAPDPGLLNEEIKTLNHFKHSMPVKIERYMSLWGWYDAIDWEVFGAKITSMMEISDVNETACDLLPDQSSHIL